MHLKKLGLTLIAGLAFIALPTQATWLYGTQGGNDNLIRIDSVTGAIENVGLLPAGSNSAQDPVQGLTGRADGTLLYTDNTLDGVHVLNPTDGGLITTLALPVTGRGGLSFDTPTNLLFSVTDLGTVVAQLGLGGPIAPLPFPLNPVFPGALGGDDQGRHFVSAFDPTGLAAIYEIDPVSGFPINALGDFFPF
ncbi:MAG: hypothetical protein KDI88_19385, partial [Gammaproteobacteria bacterium]|nr:hypothetical protein [Gammaproteobacteria bacterium]